jgi:nitronate monooxygenase
VTLILILDLIPAMSALGRLGVRLPIIQAPMAGVSTPQMAAAVSNAGALGSIAVGATNAAGARSMIDQVRKLTDRPFNVNVFVHQSPTPDASNDASWLEKLSPYFTDLRAEPPRSLKTIYKSFADDPEMVEVLLETRPPVVSFHFGLPSSETIRALKERDIVLLATATSMAEADAIEETSVDFIVAQGYEAGGHRGTFDPDAKDDCLGTFALTRLLAKRGRLPVIAAGGIMDGAGIAAALDLDEGFRRALSSPAAEHTVMTRLISGRPARCLSNRFTALEEALRGQIPPDYPIAYDAGKALNAAAKARGESGFGAQWAGQGAPLARSLPAGEMVEALARELAEATRRV